MTLRSYAGLLVLEDIFDYVPTNDYDVVTLANQIFSPNLQVIEEDCGTTLGLYQTVNYDIEGKVELANDTPLTKARIDQLLFNGTYSVYIRSTSTCISNNGICVKCYEASFPRESAQVNDRVNVYPEYSLGTDINELEVGDTQVTLTKAPDEYTYLYAYSDADLLDTNQYSISGTTLTLLSPIDKSVNFVVRYTSYNRAAFLMYLARTYSGSLLGMQPLPSELLPIRSLLLIALLDTNVIDSLVRTVQSSKAIAPELIEYVDVIVDPLEKSLYLLVLISLYNNVTT